VGKTLSKWLSHSSNPTPFIRHPIAAALQARAQLILNWLSFLPWEQVQFSFIGRGIGLSWWEAVSPGA